MNDEPNPPTTLVEVCNGLDEIAANINRVAEALEEIAERLKKVSRSGDYGYIRTADVGE